MMFRIRVLIGILKIRVSELSFGINKSHNVDFKNSSKEQSPQPKSRSKGLKNGVNRPVHKRGARV